MPQIIISAYLDEKDYQEYIRNKKEYNTIARAALDKAIAKKGK